MLTSEFNNEMGALIRRLNIRVFNEPELLASQVSERDVQEHIERAIITLVKFYLQEAAK